MTMLSKIFTSKMYTVDRLYRFSFNKVMSWFQLMCCLERIPLASVRVKMDCGHAHKTRLWYLSALL